MATEEDGEGEAWECFIEWEGRQPLRRTFGQLRAHREARAHKRAKTDFMDLGDGCFVVGNLADVFLPIAVIFGVVMLAAFAFLAWPVFVAILFGVVELAALALLVGVGFIGRTLFRRPWRVVAVASNGELWAWRQKGWMTARELVRLIRTQLAEGVHASSIVPEQLEPGSPFIVSADAPVGLLAKPLFRIGAIVMVIGLFLASVIYLVSLA